MAKGSQKANHILKLQRKEETFAPQGPFVRD